MARCRIPWQTFLGFSLFGFFTVTLLILYTQTYKLLDLTTATLPTSKIPCTTSANCFYIFSLLIFLSTMSNYHGLSLSTSPPSCPVPSKQHLPFWNRCFSSQRFSLPSLQPDCLSPTCPKNKFYLSHP